MISPEVRSKYTLTIGIECHVQLKTETKLFSAVSNNAREAEPNTLVSHICLGMPGALPVLNEKVVEYASRMAFALGVEPQKYSYFERKHYFYPDLPKGYQISQLASPIVVGGYVEIEVDGKSKKIRVNRVQIEEDAGKSTHPEGKDYSLVDLNRAGTPLLEIVSEPDIHSAKEAREYAHQLWLLARYSGVSDADLYHGNMRFDINLSVSKDSKVLGTRSETKNINSFRAVERVVEFETERQIELLESGRSVVQETRGWDDAKQKTFSQRTKEDAHDYRYFPDPDLPPIVLDDKYIAEVKDSLSIMPGVLVSKLKSAGIDTSTINTLIDEVKLGSFMAEVVSSQTDAVSKRIANWLATDVMGLISEGELSWDEAKLNVDGLAGLAKLVDDNKLSSTGAKTVLLKMVVSGEDPNKIAEEDNLLQVSDEGEIETIVATVIGKNKSAAEDIKNGELKAIGFLVGQVMKESKGKANPALAQKLIKKQLGV